MQDWEKGGGISPRPFLQLRVSSNDLQVKNFITKEVKCRVWKLIDSTHSKRDPTENYMEAPILTYPIGKNPVVSPTQLARLWWA